MVLGVALSQLDQDDAIDEFKFALNTDPKSVPALGDLSQERAFRRDVAKRSRDRLLEEWKCDEADQVLTNIVKQDPSVGGGVLQSGGRLTQQNQFRQAVEEFKEAHRPSSQTTTRFAFLCKSSGCSGGVQHPVALDHRLSQAKAP